MKYLKNILAIRSIIFVKRFIYIKTIKSKTTKLKKKITNESLIQETVLIVKKILKMKIQIK